LDNFETLNYALNEKGSDEEKTAKSLHSFFKHLAANGVMLCVTSREVTNLGGELIIDIEGLPNDIGGRLFQDNVVRQKDEIYIEKTHQVSELVGGHPLALRLLASTFDDQVGISLDQYIKDLQSHLPKARDKWTAEDRHESLRASFDFTMDNLVKIENGEFLQNAIAKLSVFIAFFADVFSAPVLENYFPEHEEESDAMCERANNTLHALWEHSLLERATLLLDEETFYLYRLHPTLRLFAKARLTEDDTVQENYKHSMRILVRLSEKLVHKSPLMTQIISSAMPDLLIATKSKSDKDDSMMQFRVGKLLYGFGLYDNSLSLLEMSLETNEMLGNLQGKSAALQGIADIHIARGDLNGATNLYQQSLEITEELGDLNGKANALRGIASINVVRGDLNGATNLYQQSLEITEELGDLHGKANTLHNIAHVLYIQGNLDGAMTFYQRSLEINEGLGNLQGNSATMNDMAHILSTRGDLDGAMKLNQHSLEISVALGDLKGKSVILHDMAIILREQGDVDGAIKLHQQSLKIKEELGDLQGKAFTLFEMANLHSIHNDLNRAMDLYQQSLEISTKIGDLRIKSANLNAMAHILRLREEFDEAMKLCKQSLEIREVLGDLQGKSTTLNEMANIYATLGDLDDAMRLYTQSLVINEELGDLHHKASTLNNMGVVLLQNNQYPRALQCFVEALFTFEKMGARPNAQMIAETLIQFRQMIEYQKFDALWRREIGQSIPAWLTQTDDIEKDQYITIEKFIAGAIQSAREKHPEAEQYFKEAQRLASSADVPAELQELGKVLQKIMLGAPADLSTLTGELREMVGKVLNP